MIPVKNDVVEVQSSMSGKTGQFSVDENSIAKIMGVLTNLYSDPEAAVVREYLTNALDAQLEAQINDPKYVWRPVEISLPTRFQKAYTVRDFGIGMSADEIESIYARYGKSTKEQSNDFNGMLGLGSKCALTYTNQFTITGFKNGIRTVAIISKNEEDIPVFQIVSTTETDEPNGFEVSVPVRDYNTFAEKTAQFLRWWEPGQVLVDGVEPVKHEYEYIMDRDITYDVATLDPVTGKTTTQRVTKTAKIYAFHDGGGQNYVVMGNVPYRVNISQVSEDRSLDNARMSFAAYVPMGSVSFPPNRETLTYTPRTKETVKGIVEGLWSHIIADIIKKITNAPDHQTAWNERAKLNHWVMQDARIQALTYKGDKFISSHAHGNMSLTWNHSNKCSLNERSYISVPNSLNNGLLVVTGVKFGSKPTAYFKKKVKHYMTETLGWDENTINVYSSPEVVLVEKDIDSVWLAHAPRVTSDKIKEIKLPVNKSGGYSPRGEAPFDHYVFDDSADKWDSESEVTIDVPKGKSLVFMSPADMRESRYKRGCRPENVYKRLGGDVILAVMGTNRFEKFKRIHPEAVHLKDFLQAKINKIVKEASDAQFVVKELQSGEKNFLSKVKSADIKDPELRILAEEVQKQGAGSNSVQQAVGDVDFFRTYVNCDVNMPEREKPVVNVARENYRLLRYSGNDWASNNKHLLIYVNALYEAEYAPKKP